MAHLKFLMRRSSGFAQGVSSTHSASSSKKFSLSLQDHSTVTECSLFFSFPLSQVAGAGDGEEQGREVARVGAQLSYGIHIMGRAGKAGAPIEHFRRRICSSSFQVGSTQAQAEAGAWC